MQIESFSDVLVGTEAQLLRATPKGSTIVFDTYEIDHNVQSSYRGICRKLVCIDDLCGKVHDCDILFDGNISRKKSDYDHLILNKNSEIYVGSDFQIIDEELSICSAPLFYNDRDLNLIYMSFGASGQFELLKTITSHFLTTLPELKFAIPNSFGNLNLDGLGNVIEISERKEMREYSGSAFCGIGAAGTMTWERNIQNLPTFHFVLAANQEQVAKDMKNLFGSPYQYYFNSSVSNEIISNLEGFVSDKYTLLEIHNKLQKTNKTNGVDNLIRKLAHDL